MDWLRLHHDTSGDGKFRTIARRAKLPMHMIRAVWEEMLINASKAEPRGTLSGWDHEDVAAILDMDPNEVEAVFEAMQGKTLDGMRLSGWDRRQPKRERNDPNAPTRAKEWRDAKKTQPNATERHANATERLEERRVEEIREEEGKEEASSLRSDSPPEADEADAGIVEKPASPSKSKGSRLPVGAVMPAGWSEWALAEGHSNPQREWEKFHDYWTALPGQKGVKTNWEATWRNWVRRCLESGPRGPQPPRGGGSTVSKAFDDLDASLFARSGP